MQVDGIEDMSTCWYKLLLLAACAQQYQQLELHMSIKHDANTSIEQDQCHVQSDLQYAMHTNAPSCRCL